MNTAKASAIELAKAIAKGAPRSGVQVGMAPPFVYLDVVTQAVAGSPVLVGAQDLYFEKSGAFTGEVSAEMLKDVGAKFALTGHSERRHVLGESSKLIMQKAQAAYGAGLILVHCVGEKLDERDGGRTLSVVQSQLEELSNQMQDPDRVVIAYEPVWAIGTGRNATDEQAQEVHAYIRQAIGKLWNTDFANRVRIIYGGSMKPENAKGLMNQPDVDGGLIGGASLKADSFLAIVNAAV
jgi:triosephosphate isomerase